jgi:tetratricopeptide (TPR) repeat protein
MSRGIVVVSLKEPSFEENKSVSVVDSVESPISETCEFVVIVGDFERNLERLKRYSVAREVLLHEEPDEVKYVTNFIDIVSEIFAEDKLSLADIFNEEGSKLISSGSYDLALLFKINFLSVAKEVSEELFAEALNDLAVVHNLLGQNESALESVKRSLEIRQKLHGGTHADVLISLENEACILGDLERYAEAMNIHNRVLEIYKAQKSEENVVQVANNICFVLRKTEKYEEALKMAESVLPLASNFPHLQCALKLNIGKILRHMNKPSEALKYFEELVGNSSGQAIKRIALFELGNVYLTLDNLSTSRNYFEEALELFDPADAHHEQIIQKLREIGQV